MTEEGNESMTYWKLKSSMIEGTSLIRPFMVWEEVKDE